MGRQQQDDDGVHKEREGWKDEAGRPEWGVRGLGTESALRWKMPDTHHLKHPRQIFHEKQAVS